MRADWIEAARRRLLVERRRDGGWAYAQSATSAAEPTALAGLSLLSSHRAIAAEAAAWLASKQRSNGSIGVTHSFQDAGWPTSYACLLWTALESHTTQRTSALNWLLGQKGETAANPERWPLGHDMQLVGWPWLAGTHSWVEPTSLAILALSGAGMQSHGRTKQGVSVLRDRAIPTGGWNMGNPVVFGTPLRPVPAPTGLALLALSTTGRNEPAVEAGIEYLQRILTQTSAPVSLGWGLLGLRAWECEPKLSDEWLENAFDRLVDRPGSAISLAMLILAADRDSLRGFGAARLEAQNSHE